MFLRMVYDESLAQAAYLIGCQRTGEAIVIDPERNVDRYESLARQHGLRLAHACETHIHADFLSGCRELAQRGAKVYLSGEGGSDWSYAWAGEAGARLLRDGDVFRVGMIEFRVMHTPGHTPEHVCFLVTDRGAGAGEPMGICTGDFLFVGDVGRPDLLETAAGQRGTGEALARRLFQSLERLGNIPDFVQVWPGHGAGSACGKALGAVPFSTVGYERRFNPALVTAREGERVFVEFILSGQPEPPLYFARMKRDNRDGPRVLAGLPRPARLGASELLSLDTRGVALIDTRSWDAFRSGHVPGALFHPVNNAFPTDTGSMIREDEPIYLLIDEHRVEEAVRMLVRVGLDRIEGWFPLATIDAYAAAGGRLATSRDVTPEEAARLMQRDGVGVLDVRRASEHAEGHIPGALCIAHTRLASRLEDVPRNRHVVVHCRSGGRSARAVAYLERAGYDVSNLAGGFLAWQESGGAIERT
jgi:hydroxyacylglutathione hydrolase